MSIHDRPWSRRDHHPPVGVTTLIELLSHRAETAPERAALRYLRDGEQDVVTLTTSALWRDACAVAAYLQARLPVGARVLLPHPPGLEFSVAFYGCVLAGMVAVPVPPPDPARPGRALPRLQAVCDDAEVAAVLTVPEVAAQRDGMPKVPIFSHDDVDPALASRWVRPQSDERTPIYLQYTSGSTARPKGVVIDHANVLHNCAELNEAYDLRPDSVMVYWVPTYHDLGLVYGVVLPMFIGFESISMSPMDFLRQPARWLQAIERFGGTHSVAPNFGYDLVVARCTPQQLAGLDLSRWRHALNGGEPIRRISEQRFVALCAPLGLPPDALSHSYGMSEATAEITAEPLGTRGVFVRLRADALAEGRVEDAGPEVEDDRVRWVAGCGVPAAGTELFIVDPDTREPCAPDRIGEIWIGGGSVARGYWRAPEATEQAFGGRLCGEDTPRLRSGDLGFLRDGQLFVTGRCKDVVIIRGHNHYPQDLEWALEGRHPALRPNAAVAFSEDDGTTERLVLVTEVYPDRLEDPMSVVSTIREAVAERGLEVSVVVLCPPRTVPKTSSGKVQRARTRHLFECGELPSIERWVAAAPQDAVSEDLRDRLRESDEAPRIALLRDYLERLVAAKLRVDRDQVQDVALVDMGLDSLAMVEIAERLSFQLGRVVELGALSEPLSSLAATLGGPPPADESLVVGGEPHEPFPLYGIQQAYWVGRAGGVGGGVSCHTYHELDAEGLDPSRLEAAWQALIDRHDALRLVIDAEGQQRVLPQARYSMPVEDLRGLSAAEREARLAALRARMSHQVLPSERWPMFEIRVCRLVDDRVRVYVSIDLLLADGASLARLMDEWGRLYVEPERPLEPLPPCTFRDCALADQAAKGTARYEASRAWWRERRPDFPTAPALPLACNPEQLEAPRFVRRRATLDPRVWQALQDEAHRRRLTISVVLCTAFAEVLEAWSGAPFMLNLTTFRRAPIHPRIHEIIGDFTTMAFLDCRRSAWSFVEYARRLQGQLHAQLDHRVVHGVEVLRMWSHEQPVQVPVVFTSMVRGDGTGRWDTTWLGEETFAISQTPHVWIDHQILELNGALVYRWDAVEALFPEGLLDAMFAAFGRRVQELATTPSAWDQGRPELLPPADR
ncbi:MAG: AMP-binding protein, partial [Myxococcales bacterium]|nr:AMP-binding protein [Myxococcales bacterium]